MFLEKFKVEDALRDLALPSAQLSCSLDEYINIIMGKLIQLLILHIYVCPPELG